MWTLLTTALGLSAANPCAPSAAELPATADARLQGDILVVRKQDRRIARYRDGSLLVLDDGSPACWQVGLAWSDDGTAWTGTKTRRGDSKTPEGWYRTSDKPWSRYHGAIAVHYPARRDADAGLAAGRIDRATHTRILAALEVDDKPPQETPLGGEILIHGGGGSSDWTLGCIGMDDADIDALRATMRPGMRTNVLILP